MEADSPISLSRQLAEAKKSCAEAVADFGKALDAAADEQTIQDYLERHPFFLPGLRDCHGGVLGEAVVTKLPFGRDFVSDFAFISKHSMKLQFTFIEIESPTKKIFNQDDSFSADFNHAVQQVRDWHVWCAQNLSVIKEMYQQFFDPPYYTESDIKTARCYLVYGRRSELTNRRRKERWQSLECSFDENTRVMSYDRLLHSAESNLGDVMFQQLLKTHVYKNREFVPKFAYEY